MRLRGDLHPLAALALVLGPGLVLRQCWPLDELRYLEVIREMQQTGNLVVPHLRGEPYLHKPAFLLWQILAGSTLTGLSTAVCARLVEAAYAVAFVLGCGSLARRVLGDAALGRRAALLAALCPATIALGQTLFFDMPIACFAVWAWVGALRGAGAGRPIPLWSWALVGLGFATKGPVVLLHVLPPLAVLAVRSSGAAALVPRPRHLAALLLVVGPILAFVVAVVVRLDDPERARELVLGQTVARVAGGLGHGRPFWYYGPVLVGLAVPWVLRWRGRTGAGGLAGSLAWTGLAQIALFSLFATKAPQYVFPLLPLFLPWVVSVLPWPGRGEPETAGRVATLPLAVLAWAALLAAAGIATGLLPPWVGDAGTRGRLIAADLTATGPWPAVLGLAVLVAMLGLGRRLRLETRYALLAATASVIALPVANRLQLPERALPLLRRALADGREVRQLFRNFHGSFYYLLDTDRLEILEGDAAAVPVPAGTWIFGFEKQLPQYRDAAKLDLVLRESFFGRSFCIWKKT